MKQAILLFLLLFFGICTLSAQEDTTKIKLPTKPHEPNYDSVRMNRRRIEFPTYDYRDLGYNNLSLPTNTGSKFLNFEKLKNQPVFNSSYSKFIIPTAFISYGVLTRTNKSLRKLDTSTNQEVGEHVSKPVPYDDYLQYVPTAAVYGLDLMGIKAKHNFRDRTLILATSYLVMGATVQTVKTMTKVERPDGSAFNSFPSGHTATAFLGAHVLFKEYKDTSPWIGVAAYGMAGATGAMRVINKKHWVSDVVAGAGVGILSAEIGYMLLPVWHNILGIKEQNKSLVIVPMVGTQSMGVGVSYTF